MRGKSPAESKAPRQPADASTRAAPSSARRACATCHSSVRKRRFCGDTRGAGLQPEPHRGNPLYDSGLVTRREVTGCGAIHGDGPGGFEENGHLVPAFVELRDRNLGLEQVAAALDSDEERSIVRRRVNGRNEHIQFQQLPGRKIGRWRDGEFGQGTRRRISWPTPHRTRATCRRCRGPPGSFRCREASGTRRGTLPRTRSPPRSESSSGVTSRTERLVGSEDASAEPVNVNPPTRIRPVTAVAPGSSAGTTVSRIPRRLRNVPGFAETRAVMSRVTSVQPESTVPTGKEAR